LNKLNSALAQWSIDFDMNYEIFRGDSFQCLIPNPRYALRLSLIILSYLRGLKGKRLSILMKNHSKPVFKQKFNARIAIGIGKAELLDARPGRSFGEAFLLSGHALDKLKFSKQCLTIDTADSYRNELSTSVYLLDFILSGLSAHQSEAICLRLLGYNENEIAQMLGVNQSAVSQRLSAAGWRAISACIRRFESIY
jgi:hypothetical protein